MLVSWYSSTNVAPPGAQATKHVGMLEERERALDQVVKVHGAEDFLLFVVAAHQHPEGVLNLVVAVLQRLSVKLRCAANLLATRSTC